MHINSNALPLGACPHSYANFHDARIVHADIFLTFDFETRIVSGTTALKIERPRS